MYSMNLILKKTGHSEFTLFSEMGNLLYVIDSCVLPNEAMNRAKAWASTWNSVSIILEE